MRSHRWSSGARALLTIACLGMLVGALPTAPARAGITITRALDNTLDQFSGGTLQRTALAQVPKDGAEDVTGGVQLGRIGVLRTWFPGRTPLPKPLIKHAAVVVGNRLYVIGGSTNQTGTGTPIPLADVISIQIEQETGEFNSDWRTELPLPPVIGSKTVGFDTKVAPIVAAAATTVTINGTRYIYVIGGNVTQGTANYSSFAVRVAPVGPDGVLGAWTELTNAPVIPVPGIQGNDRVNVGREAAVALNATINGRTFIYVLGGQQNYNNNGVTETRIIRSTLFAEVGSDGKLYKPSSDRRTEGWEESSDIPVIKPLNYTPDQYGLTELAGTIDRYPAYTNPGFGITNGATMITLLGGARTPGLAPDSFVYRAVINEDAANPPFGGLIWLDSPNPTSPNNFSMPEARRAHGVVAFGGNLYVPGGLPGTSDNPDDVVVGKGTILTSYYDDQLRLPVIPGGTGNFNKTSSLSAPRAYHATALVRGVGRSNSGAYVYVVGGRGPGEAQNGSTSIFYGKLGESEEEAAGYALDGWYYSKPFTLYSTAALLKEISWRAKLGDNPNADIEVSYRVSLDNDCNRPAELNGTAWTPIEAVAGGKRSDNGLNTLAGLENISMRCFQYRARLVSGVPSGISLNTPALLNFNVRIQIPGDADLFPSTVEPNFNLAQELTALNIQITNQNVTNPTEPTLSADAAGGGSFYVLLYVYGPGETPPATDPPPPTAPIDPRTLLVNPALKAYANIDKSEMGPGAVRSINNWCVANAEDTCTPVNPLTLFKAIGTYTVVVVADGAGMVVEPTPGGKNNNTKRATITLSKLPKFEIRLPLVWR